MALSLPAVPPFDVLTDPANVGIRWEKWVKGFKLYITASGIKDNEAARKRALLLHLAGPEVQDIFSTLDNTGDDRAYDTALEKLDAHFKPQRNIPYERHMFRQAEQSQGEAVDSFVCRLKTLAATCEFGNNRDDFVRDQVIDKCHSNALRRRLLREKDLTLAKLQELARAMEAADQQADKMEKLSVNAVHSKPKKSTQNRMDKGGQKFSSPKDRSGNKDRTVTCFRCGREGHTARECTITQGKQCNKCGKDGHFAKVCKTKMLKVNQITKKNPEMPDRQDDKSEEDDHVFTVTAIKTETSDSNAKECVMPVTSHSDDGELPMLINGQPVQMLIDSGASCNVVNMQIYSSMQSQSDIVLEPCLKKVYPYGSATPLAVEGVFTANIKAVDGSKSMAATVLVVKNAQTCVLGRKTATALGLLHIGPKAQVNSIQTDDTSALKSALKKEYKECFDGLGKLKDFQLKLHVDTSVKPVAQPVRRLPFSLRKKVAEKLKQLEEMDVVERVNGPTPWVSPLVIVHKSAKEIRLCVDMRRANDAIVRERHPIPTIDEILEDMNGATVFSKLDLKWGYHQIELTPESRSLTTFVSHTGLWRYKRLLFGV